MPLPLRVRAEPDDRHLSVFMSPAHPRKNPEVTPANIDQISAELRPDFG